MGEQSPSFLYDDLTDDLADDLTNACLSLLAQLKQAGNLAFGSLELTYNQAMLLMVIEQGFTRPKDLANKLGIVFPALS